jgi:Sec-independent protein translocase protein TatA
MVLMVVVCSVGVRLAGAHLAVVLLVAVLVVGQVVLRAAVQVVDRVVHGCWRPL